jgi:soluble lytic murein transglycosylase-like protein
MVKRFFSAAGRRMVHPKTVALTAPLGVLLLTAAALCSFSIRQVSAESTGDSGADRPDGASALSAVFMPDVRVWGEEIVRWSEGYGLDPNLVATVMQIESCGDPRAVSRSGAQGLFQVMPFHFTAGEDMQNPEINARRGLTYLAESLLLAEGDIARAFAGYNGGHGVIGWDRTQWPAETRRYAYWGEGIYADAAAGRASSPRLAEWLAAGGLSLCGKE